MAEKDDIDDWDALSEDDDTAAAAAEPELEKAVKAKPGQGRRRYDDLMEERRLKALLYDDFDMYDQTG